MKAIRDAGVPLQKNVRFIMGCNEENGSSDLEYYQAHAAMPPHVFTPDGNYPLISIEKGMLRLQIQKQINDPICFMQAGTAPNAVPAVAEAQLTAAPQVPAEQAHLTVPGSIPDWQRMLLRRKQGTMPLRVCVRHWHRMLGLATVRLCCSFSRMV